MNKQQILEKISDLLDQFSDKKTSKLEDKNFRVNSDGWTKKTEDGVSYLENPTKDIWEYLDGKAKGEQLFTWDAAMRETKKAGKTIPSDEWFTENIETKNDIQNLLFSGTRLTDGSFYSVGSLAYLWSSLQSGSFAWLRFLYSGYATVSRYTNSKSYGYSVRCLKD